MPTRVEISLLPEQAEDSAAWRSAAAQRLNLPVRELREVRLCRRSIDARRAPVRIQLQLDVYLDEPLPGEEAPRRSYPLLPPAAPRVIVIGAGPGGLFAALRLIEAGIRPIVLERGKDVQARRRDLSTLQREGIVDPDSNYCFGEGGAGTYSDGKLYTRATKRGDVEAILRTLVAHGAPSDILVDAHPHIGSNRLPKVVTALRQSIQDAGGEVHFEARVVDFLLDKGRLLGVATQTHEELLGAAVLLATGHSARDIFALLARHGIRLEAKPFAMGVRIEHPQSLIDRVQYHCAQRDPHLPAASYRLATTVQERGVFSFCMCPGGFIVPAATAPEEVVVNGMSLSRRDSPFANSGLVVAVELADLDPYAEHGALAGVAYQQAIEGAAAIAGGGAQRAPAQRAGDFLAKRISSTLPPSSYHRGLTSAPLHELLPPALASRLASALSLFGKRIPGYASNDAVLVGVESRTSSPVRIPRDAQAMHHPDVHELYPCGEGAGYAGGIVSAALDGVRVAEAIAARLKRLHATPPGIGTRASSVPSTP